MAPELRVRVVADIYQEALEANMPPTKAVSITLGVSKGQAGKLVMAARREGLLPPAGGRNTGMRWSLSGCSAVRCPDCGERMRHGTRESRADP